jgi:hypothetical protein
VQSVPWTRRADCNPLTSARLLSAIQTVVVAAEEIDARPPMTRRAQRITPRIERRGKGDAIRNGQAVPR